MFFFFFLHKWILTNGCRRPLTLFHAGSHGDEGHEAAEAQVDPQQHLVEVAGDGVRVVLVHEGEGHGGDGVEEEGGAHHRQVPALVLRCPGQPEGDTEDREDELLTCRQTVVAATLRHHRENIFLIFLNNSSFCLIEILNWLELDFDFELQFLSESV